MDDLVNTLYIGKRNGVAEFGGEELCQSGSESIHKSFRKDNEYYRLVIINQNQPAVRLL